VRGSVAEDHIYVERLKTDAVSDAVDKPTQQYIRRSGGMRWDPGKVVKGRDQLE
jgi:hypothetical protein